MGLYFYAKNRTITDVLPAGLKWASLTLDTINSGMAHNKRGEDIGNYSIVVQPFAGTNSLIIDSLLLPCASVTKLTAIAKLEDDAVTQAEVQKQFNNRAALDYIRTVSGVETPTSLLSKDRMTANDYKETQAFILETYNAGWDTACLLLNRRAAEPLVVNNL